jgi:AcrR family transcriptional regulator
VDAAQAPEKAPKPISRKAAKERTRRRLLAAARRLLLSGGLEALSASAVARGAGLGGATFYEHYRNRDDLLQALADDLFAGLRDAIAQPRRDALRSPTNEEKLREQFRRPLEILTANPALFRLALAVRHHTESPLGDSSRRLRRTTRTDLVDEFIVRGYPHATEAQRRRLEMIADIHIAAVEALALGHLNGRYPDVDEVVDMLVLMTQGTRLVRHLDLES